MSESYTFTDRVKKPLLKKLNPIWWFQNDDEQNLSEAPWYMTGKPEWLRSICWQFRNPLQNFRGYVVGVQDKNYTVVGKAPVLTVQRNDIGELGWQWCILKLPVPRPFVSYCGSKFVWYLGWQPTGFFGAKFNIV